MPHNKVKKHWNENASAWAEASRKGYDVWRDKFNTPAFLNLLPDLTNSIGLDIGCGDGHNSKHIAKRCKQLIGIDISDKLLTIADKENKLSNLEFRKVNGIELPFADNFFDFVVATMSFMDMAEIDKVLKEAYRVLTPSGFIQFSIIHPCFNEHKGGWIINEYNEYQGFLMKDYFLKNDGEIHEWKHLESPENTATFKVPRFSKPLGEWVNLILKAGFYIETLLEPYVDDETLKKYPELSSTRIVAHSLIFRCQKIRQANMLFHAS